MVLQEEEEEQGRRGWGGCMSLGAQQRRLPGHKFKFKRKGEDGCDSDREEAL